MRWTAVVVLLVKVAVALIVGLHSGASAVTEAIRGLQSESWPMTSGVILTSRVEYIPDEEYPSYKASVSYEYSDLNHIYISTRVRFSTFRWGDRESAKRLVSQFPVGMSVPVYFHPEKPTLSTIEPGFQWGALWGLALGFLAIGYGALIGYFVWEDLIKESEVTVDWSPT